MAVVAHEPPTLTRKRPAWLELREMWASLAIGVVWLAVLFSSVFGGDIVTVNGGGSQSSTVPSGVAVALFAFLATWGIAKYGFRRPRNDD